MTQSTCPIHDIQLVTAILPCHDALAIHFTGGLQAMLQATHPDHEVILLQARESLARCYPVGVLVDAAGELGDLSYATLVSVRAVKDNNEDINRLEIWFWNFGPVCYLTRDHPDFDRIRRELEDALAANARVWFAHRTWAVVGETEVWHKIMDVRSAAEIAALLEQPAEASAQANGIGHPELRTTETSR